MLVLTLSFSIKEKLLPSVVSPPLPTQSSSMLQLSCQQYEPAMVLSSPPLGQAPFSEHLSHSSKCLFEFQLFLFT